MAISDSDAQKCMGFLEVVRTMIDNAEVEIASATKSKDAARLLDKTSAMVSVAARNLEWVSEGIRHFAVEEYERNKLASAVDRTTAGNAVESEPKTGSDTLPV